MRIINKYKKSVWDRYYSGEYRIHILPKDNFFVSYDIYLCDKLIQKYVPKFSNRNAKICEIGSGDGKLLKKFALMLGYKPYGIEYSKEAVAEAKRNNVKTILADAFDKKFLRKYRNYFDVVFSYGFIEHIMPPEKAIKIHYDILKPGGYAIIQIPRLKGFNFIKTKILRPGFIPLHNLDIMDEDKLKKICASSNVEEIFCKNYGTFKLRFPMETKNIRYYLLKFLCYSEYIINPLLRFLFRDKGFETSFFSPAVMFIGKKKLGK